MPPIEEAVTVPSINQLRSLVEASAADTGDDAETEAPAAPVKKAAKTEPVTEPATQEKERNADGTFVKAKADDEAVPAGVQKRIDKAVKAQREAERELAAERAKTTQVTPPAKETVKAPEAPKQEDFTTYDEYSRAIARYEARQEIDKEVAKQVEAGAKAQREATQATRAKAFGDAEIEARKTRDDYDEITSGIEWPKAPGTSAMADYLLETNNAALYYELGKQPAELARMAAMAPLLAIAAIAKFEAKLDTSAVTETPAKAELPRPPKNVGGGGSPSVVDLDKASMSVFKREFAKRLKAGHDD